MTLRTAATRVTVKLALRDLTLVALTILLWLASLRLEPGTSPWAVPVAIAAGVMIPVGGFLAHEWGHLIGAWASGARVHMSASLWTLFLFDFRPGENSREQFLSLSCGGFIASALVVALLLAVLSPARLADAIALGLTLLGVLATFVLEVPPAWRAYRKGVLPLL
ncbi:MAG TPA: hypothetical protein VNJ47_09145 [Nevskiales bacterium]|nr:hypothetical protein [Nevskiales bacterium]